MISGPNQGVFIRAAKRQTNKKALTGVRAFQLEASSGIEPL